MKYVYENEDELRKISTKIDVLIMMLDTAYLNHDPELQERAIKELNDVSRRVSDFKPTIKINVED